MKKTTTPNGFESMFFDVVTVGERGQVVIPAEARKKYNMRKGDKLLVFAHPYKAGIMLFPRGEMENMMRDLAAGLTRIQEELQKKGT